MPINLQPDTVEQRLTTIRRHLHGLTLAIDALEAEMLSLHHAPRTDGETAAQQARAVEYRQGPSEIKVIHS